MTGSEYTIICGICGIEGLVIIITIIDTQILFHVIGAVLLYSDGHNEGCQVLDSPKGMMPSKVSRKKPQGFS